MPSIVSCAKKQERHMNILRIHWLGILLSLVVSLIAFLPNAIIYYQLQKDGLPYHPLTAAGYFDEMIFYGPHIKEVIEGNWINDDTDLVEYLDHPSLLPLLPPIILRLIFFFTNSVTNIFIWNDLILPPISFLIIYLLGYQISRDKIFSSFFAFSIVGISIIGDVLPLEKLWISGWDEFIKFAQPMYIARTYNYALTFIFFALAVFFTHRLLSADKFWDKIVAAVISGLLIHMHYFYGAYFGMGLIFLTILLFLKKDFLKAKNILFVLIIMELMAAPYLFQMAAYRIANPHWFETLVRLETDVGRHIYLNIYKHYILYAVLVALLIFVGKKVNKTNTALLFSSLIIAGFVGLNLQVILGYSLMPNHWLRTNVFGLKFAALTLFWWLKDFWWFSKKYFYHLTVFGLTSFIILSIINQAAYGFNNYKLFTIPSYAINSFNWLKENTPTNSVVMTPSTVTNNYLPVYTNNKIFMGSGYRSIAESSELEERLLSTYNIFGVDSKILSDAFNPKELSEHKDNKKIPYEAGFQYSPSLIEYIYNNLYINISIDPRYNKPPMPTSVGEKLVERYEELKTDLATIESKYEVDYIYIGPLEKEIARANFNEMPDLTKVYDQDEVQIYKINK